MKSSTTKIWRPLLRSLVTGRPLGIPALEPRITTARAGPPTS
jgi:hypothetical protein